MPVIAAGVHPILINGAWVDALATALRQIDNPATLEPLGNVSECAAADVARAVAAAKAALPAWRPLAKEHRQRYLCAIAADVGARARSLAALMTQESGLPIRESIACAARVAAVFASYGRAECCGGGRAAEAPDVPGAVEAETAGVLGIVVPSDVPLLRAARAMAPAIARGSTIICQAPRCNPLSVLSLAQSFQGLPAGVVNVLTGGAEVGSALAACPDVELRSRGGSTERDLLIVCRDADLELAVPGVAWARLRNGGQSSTVSTRIYVEQPMAAAFADRLHEYIAFLEVGDPSKPGTDLGPLISREAVSRVGDQVAYAVKEGARLKLGGLRFRPWGLPGHFFQPTILTDVRHESLAAREDILGPVLSIIPVADAREAIGQALGAQVAGRIAMYTRDSQLAAQAMKLSEVGGGHSPIRLRHVTACEPWWFPRGERK